MGDKDFSQKTLRETANAVRDALHRGDIDTYTDGRGYTGVYIFADPISYVEDEDEFPGYLIVLGIKVLKKDS